MKKEKGQALITLLVFIMMALVITSAAVVVVASNSASTSIVASSEEVLKIAESGVDNAILRLLRNPAYTGETLTFPNGTVTINVTGSSPVTIISEGANDNFRRKIQATGTFSNNIFTINSWSEI